MILHLLLPTQTKPNTEDTYYVSTIDIDNVINNTYNSVIIENILRYIEKPNQLIDQCILKLRKGGTLIIQDADLMELSRAYYLGVIDNKTINEHISNSIFLHSLIDIIPLINNKISITKKYIDDYHYYIEGVTS